MPQLASTQFLLAMGSMHPNLTMTFGMKSIRRSIMDIYVYPQYPSSLTYFKKMLVVTLLKTSLLKPHVDHSSLTFT